MIFHPLRTALRPFLRDRGFTLLNVGGLALGMTCVLLIALYVQFELGYDRHHAHADRIVRVVSDRQVGGAMEQVANVPFPVGPALASTFSDIEAAARLFRPTSGVSVQRGEQRFIETPFFFADPSVFDVFTLPFLAGDPGSALDAPLSVVLTERTARTYFGDANPIGQTVTAMVLGRTETLEVTGVIADLPVQSHVELGLLTPFDSPLNGWRAEVPRWDTGILGAWTYVLLADERAGPALESRLSAFVADHAPASVQGTLSLALQPLTSIHLGSHRLDELGTNGSRTYLYVFVGVALLVLLIACINFVNLATAQSLRRAREVGVRKALGATRPQLVGRHLVEATVLSFAAVLLAVGLAALAVPTFGSALDRALSVSALGAPVMLAMLVGVGGLTGLLSGLYPAFVLSGFQPVRALKGDAAGSRDRGFSPQTALIVGQFASTAALFVVFLTVFDQLDYIQHKELGFEQDHLLVLTSQGEASFDVLKRELTESPHVTSVTVTARVPAGRHVGRLPVRAEGTGSSEAHEMPFLSVEQDFVRTLQMRLLDGRDFGDRDENTVLLNEAAVRAFGWDDGALGKQVTYPFRGEEQTREVVGVVADMHFESLHASVEPMVLAGGVTRGSRVIVRISPDDVAGAVAHVQDTWDALNPQGPVAFYFMDERIDSLYVQEQRLQAVIWWFTGLAIVLSCLGLFGVVALSTQRRAREIGTRRALGASVADIVVLFSRKYVLLVGLALGVAFPVAYLVAERWLAAFAYRVEVTEGRFLVAGGAVLLLVLLTAGAQSARSALISPVETLRE